MSNHTQRDGLREKIVGRLFSADASNPSFVTTDIMELIDDYTDSIVAEVIGQNPLNYIASPPIRFSTEWTEQDDTYRRSGIESALQFRQRQRYQQIKEGK